MAETTSIGKLILHVYAKEGTIERLDAEGPDALLDEYEITDPADRAAFTACYNNQALHKAAVDHWAAYKAGRKAGTIPAFSEPWQP
jgi:hypothetical protein